MTVMWSSYDGRAPRYMYIPLLHRRRNFERVQTREASEELLKLLVNSIDQQASDSLLESLTSGVVFEVQNRFPRGLDYFEMLSEFGCCRHPKNKRTHLGSD